MHPGRLKLSWDPSGSSDGRDVLVLGGAGGPPLIMGGGLILRERQPRPSPHLEYHFGYLKVLASKPVWEEGGRIRW